MPINPKKCSENLSKIMWALGYRSVVELAEEMGADPMFLTNVICEKDSLNLEEAKTLNRVFMGRIEKFPERERAQLKRRLIIDCYF